MLEQADVVGKLGGALGDAAQDREHAAVQLSRIRLAGDGKAALKAHLLRNQGVQAADLFMVAVEQLQKARLRAGRPFGAQ